ncbi:hypothetical protein BT93_L0778 [Corymbia citriodora subsp. variegata]|uniref:RPW8 domain-containing protein n=1 Tax=Corymbia citriodora subsp. variegata TaxID=360336 RepID=A0A8T0CRS2_CORYI|nr:hypothetical protein BT93_L0778 [Corymbia citriodora subsp. variegata]
MPVDFANAALGTAFSELFVLVKNVVKTVAAFRGQLKKIDSTLRSIEPIINEIDEFNNRLGCPQDMGPIENLLKQGKGLVYKCSNIHRLNLCMKYKHSKNLSAFNAAVEQKFRIYMPLINTRTVKETLLEVKEMRIEFKGLTLEYKEVRGEITEFRGEFKELRGEFKGFKGEIKGEFKGLMKEFKELREEFKELISSGQANGGPLPKRLGAPGDLAIIEAPDFTVGSEVEAFLRRLKERMLKEGASVIVVTG